MLGTQALSSIDEIWQEDGEEEDLDHDLASPVVAADNCLQQTAAPCKWEILVHEVSSYTCTSKAFEVSAVKADWQQKPPTDQVNCSFETLMMWTRKWKSIDEIPEPVMPLHCIPFKLPLTHQQ